MPLVHLSYKPERVSEDVLRSLVPKLPEIIASVLSTKEGPVSANEIEVRPRQVSPYDWNASDFSIDIDANWYADRALNVEDRAKEIARRIRELEMLELTSEDFVWIRLFVAGFAKFVVIDSDLETKPIE